MTILKRRIRPVRIAARFLKRAKRSIVVASATLMLLSCSKSEEPFSNTPPKGPEMTFEELRGFDTRIDEVYLYRDHVVHTRSGLTIMFKGFAKGIGIVSIKYIKEPDNIMIRRITPGTTENIAIEGRHVLELRRDGNKIVVKSLDGELSDNPRITLHARCSQPSNRYVRLRKGSVGKLNDDVIFQIMEIYQATGPVVADLVLLVGDKSHYITVKPGANIFEFGNEKFEVDFEPLPGHRFRANLVFKDRNRI